MVLAVENPPAGAGDVGSLAGSGRSPGGGRGIPRIEGPSGLRSMGSQRVGFDWNYLVHTHTHTHIHTHTHTRAVEVLPFSPPLPSFKGLLCAIHCPETEDSVVNRIKVLALEKLTFWGE